MNVEELISQLAQTEADAPTRFEACETEADVEALRVEYLGRKSVLTAVMRSIGQASPEDRPKLGALGGRAKKTLTDAHVAALERCARGAVVDPQFDPTLPGRTQATGRLHPLTLAVNEMISILREMGFTVAEGPEIEDDYHNFEALNFPPDHPARDMQDTYFLPKKDTLLRTHTSPTQIRTMLKHDPPVRVIMPGRVYRNEEVNARSMNQFNQIEGLYVDKDVTFADLKGTIDTFCRRMFSPETKTRFRPSYFPFTEPSVEVDVTCIICSGTGCRVCKNSGWLEVMGAGMVDPAVYGFVDYDPEVYTGFAFGMGVDRTAMMRYGVQDLRWYWENDMRFLSQFG
jgi:phenylalanyl-tRNA synthetase alpha chain